MNFTTQDQLCVNNFLETVSKSILNELSTEEELWRLIDSKTKQLIDKILSIDPKEYGFKGELVTNEPVPKDAIGIPIQLSDVDDELNTDHAAYLPKPVFEAFTLMSTAFANDNPDRKLMVGSGYRSPAYQITTLIYILAKIYDFDLEKTLKRVAMPQYSQHCSVAATAIDLLNIDGEPNDKDPQKFKDSIEYQWLRKNASKFNFYESYPHSNSDGIMWEPWHWQFRL